MRCFGRNPGKCRYVRSRSRIYGNGHYPRSYGRNGPKRDTNTPFPTRHQPQQLLRTNATTCIHSTSTRLTYTIYFNGGMERQPRRRRRPALSCLECRRRKIKCDRTDPCNHCRANKSVCQFVLNRPTAATAVAEKQRRPREGNGTDSPALSGKSPAPHGFADGLARSPDVIDVDTSRTLSGVQAAVPEAHRVSRGEVQPQVLTPGTSSPRQPGPPQPSVQHHDRSVKPGFVNQHGPGSHIELYKTRTMTSNHWMSTAPEVSHGSPVDASQLGPDYVPNTVFSSKLYTSAL